VQSTVVVVAVVSVTVVSVFVVVVSVAVVSVAVVSVAVVSVAVVSVAVVSVTVVSVTVVVDVESPGHHVSAISVGDVFAPAMHRFFPELQPQPICSSQSRAHGWRSHTVELVQSPIKSCFADVLPPPAPPGCTSFASSSSHKPGLRSRSLRRRQTEHKILLDSAGSEQRGQE
jgi:hypothetical protein